MKNNKLYQNYMMYFEEGADKNEIFIKIIAIIKPLLDRNTLSVEKSLREDLRQDLLTKIHYTLESKRFILDLFSEINYDERTFKLKKENDKIILNNFLENYDKNKIDEDFYQYINDFISYSGNVKLLSFYEKTFSNKTIDFKRKYLNNKAISLDDPRYSKFEIVDVYDDELLDIEIKNKEDIKFLKLFVENGKKLTQKEVAKKINVTQQMVSKKYNYLKSKYDIDKYLDYLIKTC